MQGPDVLSVACQGLLSCLKGAGKIMGFFQTKAIHAQHIGIVVIVTEYCRREVTQLVRGSLHKINEVQPLQQDDLSRPHGEAACMRAMAWRTRPLLQRSSVSTTSRSRSVSLSGGLWPGKAVTGPGHQVGGFFQEIVDPQVHMGHGEGWIERQGCGKTIRGIVAEA